MDITSVPINDKEMLHNPSYEFKKLPSTPSKWPERGFFMALDCLEKEDQKNDKNSFSKKINQLGLFKNKYIRLITDSDSALTPGGSRKSKGRDLLVSLINKKIQRVENKICSINFEIKYVEEKGGINQAPKEWWLINHNCLKEPYELDNLQKISFLE